MLNQQNNGRRIRISTNSSEVPAPPRTLVRREGFWGKPNDLDRRQADKLQRDYYLAERSAYVEKSMATLAVYGHRVVSNSVLEMEDDDETLPPSSLARHVGVALTAINAQLLAEGHVANLQSFTQIALSNLRKAD